MQIFADSNNVYYSFTDKYKNQKSQKSFEVQNMNSKNSSEIQVISPTLTAQEISAQYSNSASTHLTQDILNSMANNQQSEENKSFSLENTLTQTDKSKK